jgi:rhamnogalacturonyl hydrolase YesR
VELLKTMAAALAQAQGPDGLWRPNLADPAEFPMPESSGSGFFCYGLAWGINHGVLDRATYLPVVQRAWRALRLIVGTGITAAANIPYAKWNDNGKVQWGQPVGDRPVAVKQEDTQEYVTGAFLLAGSKMYKLASPRQKE